MSRLRATLAAVLLGLCLAACSPSSGVTYRVPLADAKQTLLKTELPPYVFGTDPPTWDVHDEGSQVTWIIWRGDGELFRYTAHLQSAGADATRVTVELKGVRAGPAGDTQARLDQKPEIRDMYLAAIREKIASALEHRDFQMAKIYPQMAAATASNMPALQKSVDEAAAASEAMDRDNIMRAYRAEAAGKR